MNEEPPTEQEPPKEVPQEEESDKEVPARFDKEHESSASSDGEVSTGPETPEGHNLFGQRDRWKDLRAGKEELDEIVAQNRFEIQTSNARKICKGIVVATQLYEKLLESRSQEAFMKTETKLRHYLRSSQQSVEELNLVNSGNAEIFSRDIYCHVIPNLVGLIDQAIKTRTVSWGEEEVNLAELQQLISLLQSLASLCERALKSKHALGDSVENTVRRRILLNASEMAKGLAREARRQKMALECSGEAIRAKHEHWLKLQKEKEAAHLEKVQRRRQATAQAVANLESGMHRFGLPSKEASPNPPAIQWTEEEDDELLKQLAFHSDRPSKRAFHFWDITRGLTRSRR